MTTGPYGDGATQDPTGYPPSGYGSPGDTPPGNAPYAAPAYFVPQPGFPPPGYPAAPVGYGAYPHPRNGLGTAALVLGIVGVVLCWIPFTGWALNILAVVFGAIGRKRAVTGQATNKSSAVAGLVLGVIGLAVWVVILIVLISAVGTFGVGVNAVGT